MKRQQAGFTLIELAIVLVIIGLLLGGVLKGQELINSAKVKSMASDFKNVQVYLYGYQDRFRALPGDDVLVATHLAGGTLATTGSTPGNGTIDGVWSSTTTGNESVLFWQHVRLAGLAPGSTTVAGDTTYLPTNADGGSLGIQSTPANTITGLTGSYAICSAGILGRYAKQLDIMMDDGNTDAGLMRAVVSTTVVTGVAGQAATATAAVVDSSKYTVCMAF